FVRSLASLKVQGPGFATTRLLMFAVNPTHNGYTLPRADNLVRELLTAVQNLPEVESASLSRALLLSGGSWNQQLTVETPRRRVTDDVVHCNAVSPGFFATLQAPIVQGRDFTERDARARPALPYSANIDNELGYRTAIINESLAK